MATRPARQNTKNKNRRHPSIRSNQFDAQQIITDAFDGRRRSPKHRVAHGPLPEAVVRPDGIGNRFSRAVAFCERHPFLCFPYIPAKKLWALVRRRATVTWLVGPAIVTALLRALFTFWGFTTSSTAYEVATNVILFVLTFIVVQWLLNFNVSAWIRVLHRIQRVSKDRERRFLETLVSARLNELERTIDELVRGTFRPDPPESMVAYFQSFFQEGGDIYVGVDSHLPSEYLRTYDWYLKVHGQFCDDTCEDEGTINRRIVVANRNDLTRDYLKDSTSYLEFWRWHYEHKVKLGWIEPVVLDEIRRAHGIPEGADIGLWQNHAVMFEASESGAPTLSMLFPADTKWGDITAFVEDVVAHAEEFGEGPPGFDVVDEDYARAWEAYVESLARMDPKGAVGAFLLRQLTGLQHVLDAAAGIGCESVLLLNQGFSVVSNEVDAHMQAIAEGFAERHRQRLDLRNYLWETLADDIPGAMKFDAVLCLGNSLCLVDDPDGRRKCVESFFQVLRPGGRLLIDERNFEFMLANRNKILADQLAHFPPTSGPDVMYAGRDVRGVPTLIDADKVHWRLFDRPPVKTTNDIPSYYRGRRELVLHPFRHGELYDLLEHCGFRDISVFADLQPVGVGGMPERDDFGSAAFITYVANRP